MDWSTKTKPTPANARKRIQAACDALEAAIELIDRHGGLKSARKHADNALAWARSAEEKTRTR